MEGASAGTVPGDFQEKMSSDTEPGDTGGRLKSWPSVPSGVSVNLAS